MRSVDGNNNAGKLRALGFMYRDGIGKDNLPQVCGLIQYHSALKINFHAILFAVQGGDYSKIAVENLLVIVVADLHDFITDM